MIRRPPRSTHCISSAASDVYKRQLNYKVNCFIVVWIGWHGVKDDTSVRVFGDFINVMLIVLCTCSSVPLSQTGKKISGSDCQHLSPVHAPCCLIQLLRRSFSILEDMYCDNTCSGWSTLFPNKSLIAKF